VVPEETAGPFPADGSTASNNDYNVLALPGIVRSDIRSNIGNTTPVSGAPLTLAITLGNTKDACAPLAGYAIYLWHCTREGTYSVYTTQSLGDNHLRGVQETDAAGTVRFVTVVPGCYAGRMPHMHLEIYPSLASAASSSNKIKTTQLAFPTDALRAIYNEAAGYSQSVANLNTISFATDNVFSDGTSLEMVNFSGDAASGYSASIALSIAV
jgi:protocatechuate 3,4-dioxygenase beta subunit